jgi:hypothetical protein
MRVEQCHVVNAGEDPAARARTTTPLTGKDTSACSVVV